jgi:hypothetical protein
MTSIETSSGLVKPDAEHSCIPSRHIHVTKGLATSRLFNNQTLRKLHLDLVVREHRAWPRTPIDHAHVANHR